MIVMLQYQRHVRSQDQQTETHFLLSMERSSVSHSKIYGLKWSSRVSGHVLRILQTFLFLQVTALCCVPNKAGLLADVAIKIIDHFKQSAVG